MPRYKLTIEYDGSSFCGWQRQDDLLSVQEALERAVEAFSGQYCEVVGSGRTDAGVHARGQVAHVDLPKEYPDYNVMMGINFHLRETGNWGLETGNQPPASSLHSPISVIAAEMVDDTFHARFSATNRHYLYRILNRRAPLGLDRNRMWHVPDALDVSAMQKAASLLIGHHDFTSFRDSECQAKSPLKTLDVFEVKQMGEKIHFNLSARSFLHHQVRILAGTLVQVGKGRWSPEKMLEILAAKDRAEAGPTAPPEGLYFMKVEF